MGTRAPRHHSYLLGTSLTALNAGTAFVSDSFSYDSASRLQTVTDNGSGSSATYSYLANSPLVGQIAFANGGQTRMTTTKQYDYLNRLTSISSVPSAAAVVSFAYQYNSANQRTAVTGNDGSYWTYGYDPLGQVTNGFKSWADTTLVAGEQFQYGFDTIGNRTRTAAGGDSSGAGLCTANYHANLLNQYTNRDVPGAFDVLGLALATNTTVAVNGQTPYRKSEFFRQQLSVTNSTSAVWQSVSVTATNAGTTTGNVFVAQTPEHFTYDLDGNLTSDGHWAYTWDAENRLIGMTNIAPAAPAQGLAFAYDWNWRRVQKQVWYSGSLTNNTMFLYDGVNLMARLNATNSDVVQFYVWGLDLSGSPQGAGGVGGLLEISDSLNGGHFAAFDGNGNVAGLVTAGTGTNSAAYEYSPFGELVRATGPMCKVNPLRFSTKHQDDETDLLYYGYRYLKATTGGWLSPDPVAEAGGPNLYGFCGNNCANTTDSDGRFPPVVLIYSFGRGISHGILGCYDCRECLKCKDRAQQLLEKYVKAVESHDDAADQLATWLRAARPGAECAPICGDCLKEFVLFAKWFVGGVAVKYGIKYVESVLVKPTAK